MDLEKLRPITESIDAQQITFLLVACEHLPFLWVYKGAPPQKSKRVFQEKCAAELIRGKKAGDFCGNIGKDEDSHFYQGACLL